MKRLFSVLCIAILFAACSSDDDSPAATNKLEGSWTLTQANLAVPVDFNNDGTLDRNFKNEVPCFESDIVFRADNTFTQNISTVDIQEANGDFTVVCDGTITTNGTYELNGDQLTTTVQTGTSPEVTTVTINLSETTLKTTVDFDVYGNVELVYQRD